MSEKIKTNIETPDLKKIMSEVSYGMAAASVGIVKPDIYDTWEQFLNPKSNTSHSDLENIDINKIGNAMNYLETILGEEDYKAFIKYCEGLKLKDLLNSDGTFKGLDYKRFKEVTGLDDAKFNEMNERIKNSGASLNLSSEFLNSTIINIANTDSGFDAMRLKNSKTGNIMDVVFCTNDSSTEDIAVIGYVLSKYLTGSGEFAKTLSHYLNNIVDEEISEKLSLNELANIFGAGYTEEEAQKMIDSALNNKALKLATADFEGLYQQQIQDAMTFIKESMEIAKKDGVTVEEYGYSLGGGIQAAAYAELKKAGLTDIISSVTLYNPFLLAAQEHRLTLTEEEQKELDMSWFYAVSYRYSEDDSMKKYIASLLGIDSFPPSYEVQDELCEKYGCLTFTGVIEEVLMRRRAEILCKGSSVLSEIQSDDKFLIYSVEGDFVNLLNDYQQSLSGKTIYIPANDIDCKVNSIEDFLSLIVGNNGNHGYNNIIMDSFDKNGNITDYGEFKNMNELMYNAMGMEYTGDKNIPDLSAIIGLFIDSLGVYGKVDSLRESHPSLAASLYYMIHVFETDAGNYSYDKFVSILTDGIMETIKDEINKQPFYKRWAVAGFGDVDGLRDGIINALKDEEIQKQAIESIGMYLMNNSAGYEASAMWLADLIKSKLIEATDGWFVEDYVNNIIIDQVVSNIKSSLVSLKPASP